MREIKFRAWNIKCKSYEYLCDEIKNDIILTLPNCEVHEVEEYSSYDGGGLYHKNVSNNFILEQYTGLKDKNGVEIYEGDIIIWEHLDNVNYIIKWDTKEAHYFADHVINKDDSAWIDNEVIVTGDIHNNPELLELQEQEG